MSREIPLISPLASYSLHKNEKRETRGFRKTRSLEELADIQVDLLDILRVAWIFFTTGGIRDLRQHCFILYWLLSISVLLNEWRTTFFAWFRLQLSEGLCVHFQLSVMIWFFRRLAAVAVIEEASSSRQRNELEAQMPQLVNALPSEQVLTGIGLALALKVEQHNH